MVATDNGPEDDMTWWQAQWQAANSAVAVLKYLKYAVIEIDYSALHFSPDWLNKVRRYGVSMWGRPRADIQIHQYSLGTVEYGKLARYLAATVRFKSLLEDLEPPLRRAIATAGDYYEGHHKRTGLEDQLIDLVIALEALFSPKEKTELRFRISHRAALLLGDGPDSRRSLGRFFRKIYDGRSLLVHEGNSPFIGQVRSGKQKDPDLTAEDLRKLGDLVRESILRMSILLARGELDRERALKSIEDSAYDPITLDALRRKTDVEGFLQENGL